jgi:hypothetical protein
MDRELKFTFSNGRAAGALALLRARMRADPTYPHAVVSTLYYDDSDWSRLRAKLNSDYLKEKVRLRWYTGPLTAGSPGFVEMKSRIGACRDKVRVATPYSSVWLDRAPIGDPALARAPMLLQARGLGSAAARLRPMFVVRYERYRFVEPQTGSRVNLDIDIAVTAVNRAALGGAAPCGLSTAVVEIKGPETDLPAALHVLLRLGCRRASFSKYSACYQRLLRAMF